LVLFHAASYRFWALGASKGVTRVDSEKEIPRTYAHVRAQHVSKARYYERGVLVEELVTGPEFSVDTACVAGATIPLILARKKSGFPPYFEEVGHVVDGGDPLLADVELRSVLADTHHALGFTSGMTHIELRRTTAGWKVIEVNCRLGGDLIPFLGKLATGIDAGQVAAAVACGQAPAVVAGRQRVAAIRFFYPDAISLVDEVRINKVMLPGETVLAVPLAAAGSAVAPPPDGHVWGRYAMVVVASDTVWDCEAALDQAGRALSLIAG
jgi:biotin carboxylase